MRRRATSLFVVACLALELSGCAGGGAGHAAPASSAKETKPDPSSGTASDSASRPRADVLYEAHEAVPSAPAACEKGQPLPERRSCSEPRADLASALAQAADLRDAALSSLESCEQFAAGLIRALRAELGPAECADVTVLPLVGEGIDVQGIPEDIRETLTALGLGARLRRLGNDPPAPPPSRGREELETYFRETLFPWISEQAQAIFVMASQGRELSGYARGIVAIESGNADMRFVEIVREAPISKEIADHEEARDVYYATLDEQLEPRKQRGRNAALVGLKEMARMGVRESERVRSARRLLSKVFGGTRVNALDALLVPPLSPEPAQTDSAGIAARVPTAYTTSLIGPTPLSANLVRAHLQMGMTQALRNEVTASSDPVSKLLLVRALFESGRTYFRSEDFQAAEALLSTLLDAAAASALSADQVSEARLLRALSVALMAGPKDATEVIATGPRFAESLGNFVLLDSLALEKSQTGGRAAFDAAYLRELIAPPGAPDYFRDLAERYRTAARSLSGDEKRIASERAVACDEIARKIARPASSSSP